ncbi:MAG TPA: anthranilate synthase component I [Bacillales bacterium]|nr:anthranilate synthase component I [Bacillales bacterium]
MNQLQSAFLRDAERYHTIPLMRKFFVDTLTPIQMFQQLKEEAVFLLESRDPASLWSRYSFIGLNPYGRLSEEAEGFGYDDLKTGARLESKDFRTLFQKTIEYLNVKPLDTTVPFYGGAVGCMAYDAVCEFEPVPVHPHNDLNFKRFTFLFCETIVAYDHVDHELYVFFHVRMDGTETKEEKRRLFTEAETKIDRLLGLLNGENVNGNFFMPAHDAKLVDFSKVRSNFSKRQYIEAVNKVKEYIRAGDVFQAVPSQRFERKINVSGLDVYRVLRVINPSPYLFYLKIDGFEVVGSSPERIVQVQNGHVEIHPIAGTRRRGDTKEEDQALAAELLEDEKERAEHFMLVDLARNDVGRVAQFGSVQTPVITEISYFSHVMHMISKVTGRLRENMAPVDALLAAFPAGTVSGAPKVRAMQILQELEPTARNLYAGAVGYLGFDGNIDSCIAIRTMVIKDGTAYVQAGGGVVADSDPELEWEESRNKAKALLKAIEMAEELFARKGEGLHV